jgi:hypothetical protein
LLYLEESLFFTLAALKTPEGANYGSFTNDTGFNQTLHHLYFLELSRSPITAYWTIAETWVMQPSSHIPQSIRAIQRVQLAAPELNHPPPDEEEKFVISKIPARRKSLSAEKDQSDR